jgi:hypothetical protein
VLTNRVASIGREGVTVEVDLGGFTLRRFIHTIIRLQRRGTFVRAALEDNVRRGAVECQITERGFE